MSYRNELIQVAAVAVAAIQDLDKGSTDCTFGEHHFTLEYIAMERIRQEKKWGTQHHSPEKWFTILGEEVGEVANAILEKDFG